jgi:hypothetical protein
MDPMTRARATLIDPANPGAYHLISRCVRRAFLCGDEAEHRREWIETGIRTQARAFAVDVLTFAVMSNHLHIVVRTDPARVHGWSGREVAERWGLVFPKIDPETGDVGPWDDAEVDRCANDPAWVEPRRERLASVSWFMRIFKQRIARRANREDGVTGHFWEGRFQSVPLLDDAAVVSCMAYVDLNPIRAQMATTPEQSDHTGVQHRIDARQVYRKACAILEEAERERAQTGTTTLDLALIARAEQARRDGPEHDLWIAPALTATGDQVGLDDYLELVDETGRMLKSGKRGQIPAHLKPILERLQIDVDSWLDVMLSHGKFLGSAVGALARLVTEAAKRGLRWIVDRTRIHTDRRKRAPPGSKPTTG